MNLAAQSDPSNAPRRISGVYPHLCTYSFEPGEKAGKLNECGIGAVVPWAGKLWMITYGAHFPKGSSHKLYSIDADMKVTLHPESVGGTPAARLIHRESGQLLIGAYLIDSQGVIRVIPPDVMPGRITAIARHLHDPENKVYYIDMEGMIYEADVHTLDVKKLFHKPVPGWHSKGGYTAQGRLVVSNNGEKAVGSIKYEIEDVPAHPENAGVLAEWDGHTWKIVERRQYTEVTGPGGLLGSPDDQTPLWSIGWDRRSLRLKVLDQGHWHTFLLPKAAHNNDPQHGWFTEWPRIRDIGNGRMMMDMHGMFYAFPSTFSATRTAGLEPISSHLRYTPDFCEWQGRLVIATDETSIMGHKHAGQPQSNLWFGELDDLREWGPASGYGGPWVDDAVQAQTPSDPFLVAGFDRCQLHLVVSTAVNVTIEIDTEGRGQWETHRTVEAEAGYTPVVIPADVKARWVRLSSDRDCTATAYFHCTEARERKPDEALFNGLAPVGDPAKGWLLYPARKARDLKLLEAGGSEAYNLTTDFTFSPSKRDAKLAEKLKIEAVFSVGAASVIVSDGKTRYRLPKGPAAFDRPSGFGWPRSLRELESERNLAHLHGTFYEVPRTGHKVDPDWERMRPVSSHRKLINDYCTWAGLLVLSGVRGDAPADGHVFRDTQGPAAVWCGSIDDLWKLGKPVGHGGPWKDTAVVAGEPSDAYLMTGYDHKTLACTADVATTLTLEVNVDHQSGWHTYKKFTVEPGKEFTYEFPQGYSAHWIRLVADRDCQATALFTYR